MGGLVTDSTASSGSMSESKSTSSDRPPIEPPVIVRCNYCTNYLTPGIIHAKCESQLRNLEFQVRSLFAKKLRR